LGGELRLQGGKGGCGIIKFQRKRRRRRRNGEDCGAGDGAWETGP